MFRNLIALIIAFAPLCYAHALESSRELVATLAQIARGKILPGTIAIRIDKRRIENVEAVMVQRTLADGEDLENLQFVRIGNNVEISRRLRLADSDLTPMKRVLYSPDVSYHFSYHPRYLDVRSVTVRRPSVMAAAGYPIITFDDDPDAFAYVYRPYWYAEDVNHYYVYYTWP